MEIIPVDDHITAIDHELLEIPGAGVTYVVRGEEVALIETGTSLTVPRTLAGLDQLGIPRDAVGHILCTHVHMDHAGGAGYLAEALPRARVYLHSMSSEHLIDPSRLLPSVERAVGPELWPVYGDVRPLAPERLHPAETLRLDLGRDVVLEALATPGHSPDHLAFWDRRSSGMFIGDATSLAQPYYGLTLPVTPPPTYSLDDHLATVALLRTQDISRFYVTHAGAHDAPDALLDQTEEMLQALARLAQEALARGDEDTAAMGAHWLGYTDDTPGGQLLARNLGAMSARGMLRYFKKRQG